MNSIGYQVIRKFAKKHNVSVYQIRSYSRQAYLVEVRREIARDLRSKGFTLMQIAEELHRSDHTTVINLLH